MPSIQLKIDVKTADRLRKWLAMRGENSSLKINKVALGDSDIDYHLTPNYSNIKILKAPFQPTNIKHKLLYNGQDRVTGIITCFVRLIDGYNVSSLYEYPTNTDVVNGYSAGVIPPTIENGYNFSTLSMPTSSPKQGMFVFLQTLPTNMYENNDITKPLRLKETYTITINGPIDNTELFGNFPSSWELIHDEENGSFFIAKPASYTFLSLFAKITITGNLTGITKNILINI